jgi:hypothetical protein
MVPVIIFVAIMGIDAKLELVEVLGRPSHLETQSVGGVAVLSVPPALARIRFDKV